MKQTIAIAFTAAALLLTAAGCGHNVATFSKGVRAVAGINPDTYTLSVGFDYGENVTIAVKEKAEAAYQGETTGSAGTGGQSAGEVTTGSKLSLKTGSQTNGYVVELEKAKAQESTE